MKSLIYCLGFILIAGVHLSFAQENVRSATMSAGSIPHFIKIDMQNVPSLKQIENFVPKKDTPGPRIIKGTGNRTLETEWFKADSIYFEGYMIGKENFGVTVDRENLKFEQDFGAELIPEARAAVEKAPAWIRFELANTLGRLRDHHQEKIAPIINNAEDPYIDEIAFAIAYTSPEFLCSYYCYPELFEENARLIYEHDKDLDYVEIVDYGTSADGDYYSTTKYKRIDTSGNVEEVEVPREVYYFHIVHPKLSDEVPTYIDPSKVEHFQQGPHYRNITAPPEGVFWRDFIYQHTEEKPDTSGEMFPILREQVMECDVVWDDTGNANQAVRAITKWVKDVMKFTSKDERPHQPVRIYTLHIGRCGEHEDLTNAASRSCLIPCRGISTLSTDHVWNEFWDKDWDQWEPVNNSHRNRKAYQGRKFGTVFARRSDGVIDWVTKEYAKDDEAATLNVYVTDDEDRPIDGAVMILYVDYDSVYVRLDSYNVTDDNGKCTFEIGCYRKFFIRVLTKYGNMPATDNQVAFLVENPENGRSYDFNAKIDGKVKGHIQCSSVSEPVDDKDDFRIFANYEAIEHITNWEVYFDDIRGQHTYKKGGEGRINFFIANRDNFNKTIGRHEFEACNAILDSRIPEGDIEFNVPTEDEWFVFLNNGENDLNYEYVRGWFTLYANSLLDVEDESGRCEINALAYPNPFSKSTRIIFELVASGRVKVNIYDYTGNCVRTLQNGYLESGSHYLKWDGTGNQNNPLPDGVYFYRVDLLGEAETGSIILAR